MKPRLLAPPNRVTVELAAKHGTALLGKEILPTKWQRSPQSGHGELRVSLQSIGAVLAEIKGE